jgi:hypothetical protein
MRRRLVVPAELLAELGEERDGRIDLAPLALGADPHQQLPEVGLGDEMVAPVALDMNPADDPVALQLLEPGRDVGAGEAELVDDLVGGEGTVRQIEQSMHLRDRAVDAPIGPHLPPVEDEGLGLWMGRHGHVPAFL